MGVKFICLISAILSLLTAFGVALYPRVLDEGTAWIGGIALLAAWIAAMGLVIGYGCNFLDSVLEYALHGGTGTIYVPDGDPRPALTSLLRWAVCFATAPAILIYLAFHYFVHCGDVAFLDGLILAELTMPAVGYWLIGLLVLARRPDLAYASPLRVLHAIRRLGRRALLAAAAASAGAFAHVCLGTTAVLLLHSAWPAGLFLLWLCWLSIWIGGAYALKTLGLWYRRSLAIGSAALCETSGVIQLPPSAG